MWKKRERNCNKQQIADVVSAEWIQDQFHEITESDKQKLKGIQRQSQVSFRLACLPANHAR